MNIYGDDRSQIHESKLLKDNIKALFIIRVITLILVHAFWWFQIYEYDEYEFANLVTNFQYLTQWGKNILMFYLIFVILDMIYFMSTKRKFTFLWKIEHFLFQFGFSSALTILLLFWAGVFPSIKSKYTSDSWFMFNQVADHGIIFILYYIEFAINNISFKWKHAILTGIGCLSYLIVNLVVTFTYKRVYVVISWASLISYIYLVAALIITAVHFYIGKKLTDKYKKIEIQVEKKKEVTLTEQQASGHALIKVTIPSQGAEAST